MFKTVSLIPRLGRAEKRQTLVHKALTAMKYLGSMEGGMRKP